MTRAFRHIALPAIAPLLFFSIAAIPIDTIGCRNRGLLAVAITLISILASLATAGFALKGRMQGNPLSFWWIVTSLILAIPAVGLLILG